MKTKNLAGLVILTCLLALVGAVAPAAAVFYNFDDLPTAQGTLVLPGVTVTPSPSAYAGVSFHPGAASPPNVYYCQLLPLAGTNTLLTITLDQPVDLVKFQIMWGGLVDKYTVNALDSNGNLLDSQGFTYDSSGRYVLIAMTARGIKTLVISSTNLPGSTGSLVAVLLDNFSFVKWPGGAVIPLF